MCFMSKLVAPLFRGTTKPPMIWGVPQMAFGIAVMIPLTAAVSLSMFFGIYSMVLLIITPIALLVMRDLTKQDDQLLRMVGFDIKEHQWLSRNRKKTLVYIPPRAFRDSKFIGE